MIKFLLLLPIKILGLLFMAIGSSLERREKERIAAARYNEKRIAAELKKKSCKKRKNDGRRKHSKKNRRELI